MYVLLVEVFVMKNFDYMRVSLDFCLYPNEIVSRFAKRAVIVYATGGEGDDFVQSFKSDLDIKYVANLQYVTGHFECMPPIDPKIGEDIKDLDALVSVRKDEPIFVLSRKYWVELVDLLEAKGLKLGAELFFWEQGYPRTELISKFIKHNESVWSSEKIESVNKILVPFEDSKHWFEAGKSVPYAYVGNYLAKKYNAEINCYLRGHSVQRDLMYKHRTSRDISRSFNANGIFDVACNRQQTRDAKKLFDEIMSTVNNWHDLQNIKVDGIPLGNAIIRDYCRFFVPSVDMKSSPDFVRIVRRICRRIVFMLEYFQWHDDIKAIVLFDGVCREGPMRDIAVSKGIPTYALSYFGPAVKLDVGHPNNRHFGYYKDFFQQLSPKEQEIGLEWARRSLHARLQGNTKDIPYMKTSIYSVESGDRVLEQNDKIKLVICPHSLSDDIHCGWSVFGCFMEWLVHLGELSNRTDYDWYLKPHPAYFPNDVQLHADFVKHYPRIKMIPAMTPPKQLKEEGVKFAFTIYGTLGHEYPALGIQVINAGNNPHVAFDFCHNPRTPEEFDELIFKLPELADKPVDMQEIYQFYCIHFLYYKHANRQIQDIFFRRPELYPWLSKKQRNKLPLGLINRHKYYLEDWTPDFHEITKHKVEELFKEMDSRQADVFYKNDEAVIQAKLEAVGMTLD